MSIQLMIFVSKWNRIQTYRHLSYLKSQVRLVRVSEVSEDKKKELYQIGKNPKRNDDNCNM